MLVCKFCNKECKNDNSLRNHERLCKANPDKQVSNMDAAKQASRRNYKCTHCIRSFSLSNLSKHEHSCKDNPSTKKECPVCRTLFNGNATTCSYACSNKHFRTGPNNGNWKGNSYRTIARIHHEMKCIICGEDKIVSIHHYDHNHNNNEPKNLIPLCPTHHQYLHSRYAKEILPMVEEYIKQLSFA